MVNASESLRVRTKRGSVEGYTGKGNDQNEAQERDIR